MKMRGIFWLLGLSVSLCFGQGPTVEDWRTEDYVPSEKEQAEDDALLKKHFEQTLVKLALYVTNSTNPQLVVTTAKVQGLSALARELRTRNDVFRDLKEVVLATFVPNYSRQGTPLSDFMDKEIMRDVDQYVKYAETVAEYGFNVALYDDGIRLALIPEDQVSGTNDGEQVMGGEELYYDGLRITEYQQKVNQALEEVMAYQTTGDDAADIAAMEGIIARIFAEPKSHQRVMELIIRLYKIRLSNGGNFSKKEIAVYEDYIRGLQPDPPLEATTPPSGNSDQWVNEAMIAMQDMGAASRNPVKRYGLVAEESYNRHMGTLAINNEEAQKALTNVVQAWKSLELAKNAERLDELYQIAYEVIENGFKYDNTKLKAMVGEFKKVWDLIWKTKNGN